jgi:hypothetical protein
MQFNLFDWIRESVKRSVILGVSDAMEAIGSPDGDDSRVHLSHLLAAVTDAGPATVAQAPKRKRLGRSLREFQAQQ